MDHTLALLVDFENIVAGTEKENLGRFSIRSLMQRLSDKGRIVVCRAYGDWGRFGKYKRDLLMNGATMVELTSHGMRDKNRADIALTVDAMELAVTREYIDTFVVVSGDSDFTPLIAKLKELNRRVIGCGTRNSTSKLIVLACDEFIFYDSLVSDARKRRAVSDSQQDNHSDKVKTLDLDQSLDLLVETLDGLQEDDPTAKPASLVKDTMRRKDRLFNEQDLGYSGFGRFLRAADKRGRIKLVRDPDTGDLRVDSTGDEEDSRDARPPSRNNAKQPRSSTTAGPRSSSSARPSRRSREARADTPDSPPPQKKSIDEALALLSEVVSEQADERDRPLYAGPLKQEIRRRFSTFDEKQYGFSGFTRFLERAGREGIVRLIPDESAGGYRVEPPEDVPGVSGVDEKAVDARDEIESGREADRSSLEE